MQFVFAPILGNLSDRYGRRRVILFAVGALGIDYIIMGFAPTLAWLFVGRAIAGAAGASFTPAYAYVADISPPEKRAQNFGVVSAAFGIGFIIGPAIGGLLGTLGPRAPFFAAAALSLINFCYGFFVLPESLPPERRRAFEWRRANPLGTLSQMKKHPVVLGLLVRTLSLGPGESGDAQHLGVLHEVQVWLVGSDDRSVLRGRRSRDGVEPARSSCAFSCRDWVSAGQRSLGSRQERWATPGSGSRQQAG